MEDLLISIDQKLDVVIYCFFAFLAITTIRSYFQIKTYIKSKWRDADADYYVDLLRKDRFHDVVDYANRQLKDNPKDLYATWYKAKALYILEEYDQAQDLFDRVQTIEPDWIDNAQSYLDRIDRKLNSSS